MLVHELHLGACRSDPGRSGAQGSPANDKAGAGTGKGTRGQYDGQRDDGTGPENAVSRCYLEGDMAGSAIIELIERNAGSEQSTPTYLPQSAGRFRRDRAHCGSASLAGAAPVAGDQRI